MFLPGRRGDTPRLTGKCGIVCAMSAQEILDLALKLPPAERRRLAESLWQSLDGMDEPAEDAPEAVEAAWLAVVRDRLASLDDGTAVLIDAKTHLARLRARFGG